MWLNCQGITIFVMGARLERKMMGMKNEGDGREGSDGVWRAEGSPLPVRFAGAGTPSPTS
jgi:hypothetical protein